MARLSHHWPTAAERQQQEHGYEWSWGWQYGCTHRILRGLTPEQAEQLMAKKKPPQELKAPPTADKGWKVNEDRNHTHRGYIAKPPVWCTDGTAIHQTLYWVRHVPGMTPLNIKYRVADFRGDS